MEGKTHFIQSRREKNAIGSTVIIYIYFRMEVLVSLCSYAAIPLFYIFPLVFLLLLKDLSCISDATTNQLLNLGQASQLQEL